MRAGHGGRMPGGYLSMVDAGAVAEPGAKCPLPGPRSMAPGDPILGDVRRGSAAVAASVDRARTRSTGRTRSSSRARSTGRTRGAARTLSRGASPTRRATTTCRAA
jgi:hypothetical protein